MARGHLQTQHLVVVLAQTDLKGARTMVERIRNAMEKLRFPHIDPELRLTVSIGVALYHPKDRAAESEKRADAALYRATTAGRNRIEIESMNAEKV
jgi:diguanylate cyclase (GGDEF)-like protein